MKPERLLILVFFLPCLICYSQSPEPAAGPAPVTAPGPTAPGPVTPGPTTPEPAAPVSAPGVDANTYVIGPEDVLSVSVWKEPTLSANPLVRPDGMISLPLLGDVQASGLTPLKLADEIAEKLKKYVQNPTVFVIVNAINSKKIYFLGEAGKSGPIPMTPGMTLLEAISSAGGLSQFANAKKIYILRDEGGKHIRIPVHYKEALKGNSQFNLILEPGDTIVVP
ncbi:MAG: polysaccharide biosynthesis/export family protein [Terracidiphilus sp.]|jgi:polysaccharide export outer membrane protein